MPQPVCDPLPVEQASKTTIIAAFLANLGIAIAKFVGFAFTGASSMLSEGVHSLADTGNQGLLLLGSNRARRPPDDSHPFGYGRERYFWAFVVALVLFTLGAAFAVYEGIHKIQHPAALDAPGWAFGVLGFSILLETFSFRTAQREAKHTKGTQTWWQYVRDNKSPEIPLVLLEDFGALTGLTVALVAVSLTVATGNPMWDGIGSVMIGAVLATISVVLAIEMKSLLIGEAADPDEVIAIREAIIGAEHVRALIHLRTQHFGPEELLVAAKVEFDDELHGASLASAVDAVEERVRAISPSTYYLFIEPDVVRATPASSEATGSPGEATGNP